MLRAGTVTRPLTYRPDIDGLRALAVTCVILLHANVPGFEGGFVGVDVFFVISGYLITAILHASVSMPVRSQLADFYWRRARRILPALLACLLISTLIALFVQLPDQLRAYGRLLAFASVLLANLGAHLNGGYFAGITLLSPLKPLWSIAVEEQFYFLYPLFFLLCVRFVPRRLTPWLLAASIASFALCVWSSYRHPLINYYLTPQRGWELLLGAIAVLNQDSLRLGRFAREVLAAVSLAAIGTSVALYDSYLRYPGTATLVPVLASACLLVVNRGPEPTYVAKLLSLRPLVFTGLISYSLYLWHAPILDFFQAYIVTPRTPVEVMCLLGLLYLVAIASWRWIEQPLRTRQVIRGKIPFAVTAVAISVLLLVSGIVMSRAHGFPGRFDTYVQAVFRDKPVLNGAANCAGLPPAQIATGHLCHFGSDDSTARKVIVWGDSHALVLIPAYEALAQREHLSLYVATAPSCRPLIDVMTAELSHYYLDRCRQFTRAMQQAITSLGPDVIVLNGYWLRPSLTLTRETDRQPVSFQEALLATLRSIEQPGRQLCAVLDVPNYPYRIPTALAMFHRRGKDATELAMTRVQADAQQTEVERALQTAASNDNLRLVNPRDALCAGGICKIADDHGMPLYLDDNHLSIEGVELVREKLGGCFADED